MTNLEELARQLFQVPETVAQCDRALSWQLKSSKDGATKDSRIAELAELTKLARRLLKQVMSDIALRRAHSRLLPVRLLTDTSLPVWPQLLASNTQFVNSAVSVQRQMEQQIEGIRCRLACVPLPAWHAVYWTLPLGAE